MTRRVSRVRWLRGAVAVVVASCGCVADGEVEPDWTQHGQYVTLEGYGVVEAELCVDTLGQLDTAAEGIASWHGWPTSELEIRYQLVDSGSFHEQDSGWCPPGAGGCADGATIRSPHVFHLHEVSHAVDENFLPGTSSLIAEGLAHLHRAPKSVDFETHHWMPEASEHEGDIAQIFAELPRYVDEGGRAAHFVSFLADTYGIDALHLMVEALPSGSDRNDWDGATATILDRSVDELLGEYASYPACTFAELRSKAWECRGPVDLELKPEPQLFELRVDCQAPGVVGMEGSKLMTSLRVGVPEELAGVLFEVELLDGAGEVLLSSLLMEECGVSCVGQPHVLSQSPVSEDNPFVTTHAFGEGVYAFVIRAEAGDYRLRIEPV